MLLSFDFSFWFLQMFVVDKSGSLQVLPPSISAHYAYHGQKSMCNRKAHCIYIQQMCLYVNYVLIHHYTLKNTVAGANAADRADLFWTSLWIPFYSLNWDICMKAGSPIFLLLKHWWSLPFLHWNRLVSSRTEFTGVHKHMLKPIGLNLG